ncbi:MAG TPA: amino acid adenylation domain-containing protein [Ktedonosporobacter sp.]|jgi:amino acid adenylation domain-containing protein|nr:amino acid adenylation domain-containing protein [Ktedonosporobacter sp.]
MQAQSIKPSVEVIYPLSPMQQGMLFHTLYNPQSDSYLEQYQYSLRGTLDVAAFKQSWEQVLQRHAILRTQFMWQDLKEPLQVVWRELALPWAEHDVRGLPEEEQQAHIAAILKEDLRKSARLDSAPLFRLILIRLQQDSYQFVWSFHHALLDGWSTAILVQEVFQLYEANRLGRDLDLPVPPPYRTYIAWLQRQDRASAEAFWRETLAGFSSPTVLQVARMQTEESARGAEMEAHFYLKKLPAKTATALQACCRQHRITLNTLVQGCWALLLSHYSGERDVVFGVVVAGRPLDLPASAEMVGLFINTLPMRVQIDPAQPFLAWLQDLQMQQVKARQYDYCALPDIQQWSDLPGNVPLFESIIAFENYPGDGEEMERRMSLKIDQISTSSPTNYPLCLAIVPGKEMTVYLAYDRRRFDAPVAEQLLKHFMVLLEGISNAHSGLSCGAISLLTPAERQRMLVDWNNTTVPYPETLCIPDAFEARAQELPDNVALVFDDVHLTYDELNRQGNMLAHKLQSMGVGADEVVGLYCERSIAMVIGALGILKAGGAYLPLDPDYPVERLQPIIAEAGMRLIVAQQHIVQALPQHTMQVVFLDTAGMQGVSASAEKNPTRTIQSDNSAYVIYTSGSTGKPKGVVVTYRGVCNLLAQQEAIFHVHPGLRILQFASQSFDVSVWEIWMSLMNGATLYLNTRDALMPGEPLANVLLTQGINVLVLTPSAMMALPERAFPALQHIVTAGEAYSNELVERWSEKAHLYNAYGPTETTCYSTLVVDLRETGKSLIGRPICNTQIYLLNEWLQPVPVGVSGEIYIGGAGLARGYMQQPAITAERFVPDPYSTTPGQRLYKTGDLARYTADGQLIFLGRNDSQVKLRGFRIELGEIEKTLDQYAAVQQCVVMVREDRPKDRTLVVYIVPKEGQQIESLELMNYLRSKLPPYMLPNSIVSLETFPMMPNGKIDKNKLPAPGAQGLVRQEAFRPPRDLVEQQLVQSIEEILQLRPISITDNFFLIGGHSLSAIRLMSEIQKRLEVQIELPVIFQAQDIAALARAIRQLQGAHTVTRSPLVPIQPRGDKAPFFCIHPASGNVSSYYNLARYLRPDRPVYGIQDTTVVEEGESGASSLEEMVCSYISVLKEIQPEGPYFLGGYSFGGLIAFEMAQQLLAQGQKVALLAIFDSHPPTHADDVTDDETTLLAIIASEWLRESSNKKVQDIYDELAPLTVEEQLQHVLSLVRQANVELLSMDPRWVRQQVLLFKSRMHTALSYKARQYPGPITFFRANERDELDQNKVLAENLDELGWQQMTALPLEVYLVPGYHNTIMNNPSVETLAQHLQGCLDRASDAQ